MALDRITELFIMEAEEHLDTLEKGLVDLQGTMEDPENINEMFRAAHSVKGGSKMLGLDSIGETSHRLEDCFKILRENPDVKVDQTVESLFLKGVDTLKELLEKLKSPYGIRDEDAKPLVQGIMPVFTQLEKHLNNIVSGKVTPISAAPSAKSGAGGKSNFAAQVVDELKKMLEIFKQQDNANTRQQLSDLCDTLIKLGTGISPWENLAKTAKGAVNNLEYSYPIIARAVITELKQSADLVQVGNTQEIIPSSNLKHLATPKPAPAATPAKMVLPKEAKAAVELLERSYDRKQLTAIVKLLTKNLKAS